MKRTFTKLFMLSAALLLSAATFAQDDGIAHRYPEFTFTATIPTIGGSETLTFTMPAWDAYVSSEIPSGTGEGYRLQLIENPVNKTTPARARIVAPRAFSHEMTAATGDRWFASTPGDITFTNYNGESITKSSSSVTYGDIFGPDTPEPSAKPFTFTKTTSSNHDLTIQSTRSIQGGKWKGYIFKIVEIGEAAFRNTAPSGANVSTVDGTVTIPNTIEKIENNAFRHGIFTKVVFEDGSPITTIEKATFEGCPNLEEIHIPASVTKIEGTAFGSCKNLRKIVFEGNLPTLTTVDEEPLQPSATGYQGPYNIFEGATRLQHSSANVGDNLTPSKCIIEVPMGQAKGFIDSNDGLFQDFVLSSKFPLTTSSGMMTYCSDLDFTFKQYNTADKSWGAGGMKAYYVEETKVFDAQESENGKLILTEIGNKKIPGWTATDDFGVVLRGTGADNEDGTYNIFYPNTPNANMTEKLSMAETGNCLHGVITQTPIEVTAEENEDYSFFILSGGKFYRVMTDGNCKAYRAYLKVGDGGQPHIGTGGAKELAIEFPETTGIVSHEAKSAKNDTFYNLQGIQVKQPSKGIFIKNGKKYVIK